MGKATQRKREKGVYGSEPGIYFLRNASQGMTISKGVGGRNTKISHTNP